MLFNDELLPSGRDSGSLQKNAELFIAGPSRWAYNHSLALRILALPRIEGTDLATSPPPQPADSWLPCNGARPYLPDPHCLLRFMPAFQGDRFSGTVQSRVTLRWGRLCRKPLFLIGLLPRTTDRSVTLPSPRLNHAAFPDAELRPALKWPSRPEYRPGSKWGALSPGVPRLTTDGEAGLSER
jgi:hypothetical protein